MQLWKWSAPGSILAFIAEATHSSFLRNDHDQEHHCVFLGVIKKQPFLNACEEDEWSDQSKVQFQPGQFLLPIMSPT